MKFIESSVEEIKHPHPLAKIELIGRTCYKSESYITSESAYKFVSNLVKHNHLAMLEHAYFTFVIPYDYITDEASHEIMLNNFMNISYDSSLNFMFISTNLRVLIENDGNIENIMRDALYRHYPEVIKVILPDYTPSSGIIGNLVLPQDLAIANIDKSKHSFRTFKFITDRGVSHELVRHRVASFAQESTRYCNYQKDKFGNEITFIKPSTWHEMSSFARIRLKESLKYSERAYMALIDNGLKPQQARAVLPNALKTEIIVTTSEAEWHHIADLRLRGTTGAPHPDIKELMQKLQMLFPEI